MCDWLRDGMDPTHTPPLSLLPPLTASASPPRSKRLSATAKCRRRCLPLGKTVCRPLCRSTPNTLIPLIHLLNMLLI
ncbi:hypothetical protein HanIR_Chr09g0434071 [Helianthus annuus]|nr:hypothetical protein HanIR_Chr09g0434071 [Helianthus annuus]